MRLHNSSYVFEPKYWHVILIHVRGYARHSERYDSSMIINYANGPKNTLPIELRCAF